MKKIQKMMKKVDSRRADVAKHSQEVAAIKPSARKYVTRKLSVGDVLRRSGEEGFSYVMGICQQTLKSTADGQERLVYVYKLMSHYGTSGDYPEYHLSRTWQGHSWNVFGVLSDSGMKKAGSMEDVASMSISDMQWLEEPLVYCPILCGQVEKLEAMELPVDMLDKVLSVLVA